MQAALRAQNPARIPEIPGLCISDISIPRSPALLAAHRITHVLSIISPPTNLAIPQDGSSSSSSSSVTHSIIRLDDDTHADLLSVLDPACGFIHAALTPPPDALAPDEPAVCERPSPRVLVHCVQGVSRSAAVVMAYVMRALGIQYAEAFEVVKRARPIVAPNEGFAEQLEVWGRMGWCAVDERGEEREGYKAWKMERRRGEEEALGEEQRKMAMGRSMGRVAAMIGRRRMEVLTGEKER